MAATVPTRDFFELVKAIGESKSKQEEDRIVAEEVNAISYFTKLYHILIILFACLAGFLEKSHPASEHSQEEAKGTRHSFFIC